MSASSVHTGGVYFPCQIKSTVSTPPIKEESKENLDEHNQKPTYDCVMSADTETAVDCEKLCNVIIRRSSRRRKPTSKMEDYSEKQFWQKLKIRRLSSVQKGSEGKVEDLVNSNIDVKKEVLAGASEIDLCNSGAGTPVGHASPSTESFVVVADSEDEDEDVGHSKSPAGNAFDTCAGEGQRSVTRKRPTSKIEGKLSSQQTSK